jgi:hypothetical protein
MIINDAREIKIMIAIKKAAFNTKENFFPQQIELTLMEETDGMHISSIALYGAETWTLRKVDQNACKVSKCGTREGL